VRARHIGLLLALAVQRTYTGSHWNSYVPYGTMMTHSDSTRAERTRRTILDAAAALLVKDASASLGDVAAAAGMGRTTLHRHFATRDDLLRALALDAITRIGDAVEAGRPADGGAADAFMRIAEAVVPLADGFRFLELGPAVWDLPELRDRWFSLTRVLEELVERGKREGDLRPELPTALVVDVFAGALWSVGDAVREGRLARVDAARQFVDLVLHGAATRRPS
jgi:AcrR family transcriptional regulator